MPRLVVEKGLDKGKVVPVPGQGTLLIGRDSHTVLPLRDTMTSRMHCKVEVREDGCWLHDLESMNGTYLNGSKVKEPTRLAYGDLIKIGETLFTFLGDDATATTLTGHRIGGYQIIERVGRGGMGTVYRAEQIDLQRTVALKVISDEYTKDKEFVDLFLHEARAAAKLNHPNIVQIYDVKRHNAIYYFSMEYVSGGSVQDVLNRQRKIPADDCVRMILEAARGLDHAHKKGLMHRDVKPDNLMIAETGSIKIGDMGLARGLNEKVGPEEETSVIGTPHYIAPEQVLGRPADFRCDIYSLGATMYRMLAGVTPFNAPSVRELVNKKVREDAASIQDHTPEVPRPVAEVVARMMARDPDRRLQTMEQVIGELEKVQGGRPGSGDRREPSTPIQILVGNRKFMAGAASVAALILGVVLYAVFRPAGPAPDPAKNGAGTEVDHKLAAQTLERVNLLRDQKMDDKDPRSVAKVMGEYEGVLRKFPGTAAATEAQVRRAELDKIHRELTARERLQLAETEDIAAYRKLSESFKARSPDLAPGEAAAGAYQAFTQSAENKGTSAVEEASRRAAHIRRWKAAAEAQKAEFERVREKAQKARDQKRFLEAEEALEGFQEAVRRGTIDCEFAADRWRSLLFDELAASHAKAAADEARSHWTAVKAEADLMARDGNQEGAILKAKAAGAVSVKEVQALAREAVEGYQRELANRDREAALAREAAEAEARKKAAESFHRESAAANALVLKHDFKGALQKMKALREAVATPEFRDRIDRRVAELERLVHLKDSLVNVINAKDDAGRNPYGFLRDYKSTEAEGTIDKADEREYQVSMKFGGGSAAFRWDKLDGPAYHQFIRRQWKYNQQQQLRDPNDLCDLAALALELGLYDDAKETLEVLLPALQNPQYPASPAVRRFAEEYLGRIDRGESAESEEIEARKRLAHLEARMKNSELEAARATLEILRTRYSGTAVYQAAQERLKEVRDEIEKKGGEILNRSVKEDALKRLDARVREEQNAARKAQTDIVQRIARIEDPFQRNVHLGSVYAASGEWSRSTEKYSEARRIAEAYVQKRDPGREFSMVLALLYAELYRNAVAAKERKAAEAIRNEGSRRFVTPAAAEEDFWVEIRTQLATWSDSVFPQEEKRLARLRDDVRAAPDDPQKVWALADAYSEGLINQFEARGYYAYLLVHHPDFQQVRNGECLWRLAEIQFHAREVREAARRYIELSQQHKEHRKVKDEQASDSVKQRLASCYRIMLELGYKEGR